MQCNTNYTADKKNYKYINLNVLNQYKNVYKVIWGLSDHTFGSETVLGAISLGARVIEKHFTDDNLRGPDHKFSMNPKTWRSMVISARKLENSLGDGQKNRKRNNFNNPKTFIRASALLKTRLRKEHLIALRPCPKGWCQQQKVLGKKRELILNLTII